MFHHSNVNKKDLFEKQANIYYVQARHLPTDPMQLEWQLFGEYSFHLGLFVFLPLSFSALGSGLLVAFLLRFEVHMRRHRCPAG